MLAIALMTLVGGAQAGKTEAETCIEEKIWDQYKDGWQVRTAMTAELKEGAYQIYLMTLYKGAEYRFQACADPKCKDVDVVLHKADGTELLRDKEDTRDPSIGFKPTETGSYYVAVYAAQLANKKDKSAISLAIAYR